MRLIGGLLKLILWIWSSFLLVLIWSCIFIFQVLLRDSLYRSYRLILILFLIRLLILFFLLLLWNFFLFNLRISLNRLNIFLTIRLILRLLQLFNSILYWIIQLLSRVPNIWIITLTFSLVILIFYLLTLATFLLLLHDLLLALIWRNIFLWVSRRLNIWLDRILLWSLYYILLIGQSWWLIRDKLSWLLIPLWALIVVILDCFRWRGEKQSYCTSSHFRFIILFFNFYLYIPLFVNNILFLLFNWKQIYFF